MRASSLGIIGLNLSQRICERLGSRIEIESEVSIGTSASFNLFLDANFHGNQRTSLEYSISSLSMKHHSKANSGYRIGSSSETKKKLTNTNLNQYRQNSTPNIPKSFHKAVRRDNSLPLRSNKNLISPLLRRKI